MTLTFYFKSIFSKYKLYFCSLIIIAISAVLFNISVDYKVKEIIDSIGANPDSDIGKLLLLFIFYEFSAHGVHFIRRLIDLKYKPIMLNHIATDMYTRALNHSLHWFDSQMSGEISSKISAFPTTLLPLISSCFILLMSILTIIVNTCFLFLVSKESAILALIFVTIYSPILTILLKKQMKLQEKYMQANQEASGIINDSIANIFSVKVIGNIINEFKIKLNPALLRWQKSDRDSRRFDAYWVDNADTIMVTIMAASQIYLLSYLYRHGEITAGGFAFISIITLKIQDTIHSLLELVLFAINPSIAALKSSYKLINSEFGLNQGNKILSNVKGEIKFENVSFAYENAKNNVFTNLNLHIKPGEKIGIVGTSGAGKTTFVKCLLKYFDTSHGTITIDDQNLKELTEESLRAHISVIPQDITMSHRSILENLQIAKYDADFAEIKQACMRARIHDDIMKMQNGYDTIVGERGIKMSGGQRQRVAIARAILKNAPILILDEATSSLDTPTEQLIQASLEEIFTRDKPTTIVIAHRLSTLVNMDRILVFEHGKIIDEGSHVELLRKDGLYKELWNAQIKANYVNN